MTGPRGLRSALLATGLLAALALGSCGRGEVPQPVPPPPAPPEAPDPRLASETDGLLRGLPRAPSLARLLGAGDTRLPSGRHRAAPLAFGGGWVLALGVDRPGSPPAEELRLLAADGGSIRQALGAPVVAMLATGDRLAVSTAEGGLALFDPALAPLERREAVFAVAMIALPGGSLALLSEGGTLELLEPGSLAPRWSLAGEEGSVGSPAGRLAYLAGIVLKAGETAVAAFAEADGRELWRRPLPAPCAGLASRSGKLAVLGDDGSLLVLDSASGGIVAEGAGRFDPAVAPVISGGSVILALAGRGAAVELDASNGGVLLERPLPPGSRLAGVDEDYLFALGERALFILPRRGDSAPAEIGLPLEPVSGPGAGKGYLHYAAAGGGLILVGESGAEDPAGPGRIDAALSPGDEVAAKMALALDKYLPRGDRPFHHYLGFDLPVEGMVLGPPGPGFAAGGGGPVFTALRLDPAEAGSPTWSAAEEGGGGGRILFALFNAEGAELHSNIDELGATPRLATRLEKGRRYWLVTGRLDGGERPYRLGRK